MGTMDGPRRMWIMAMTIQGLETLTPTTGIGQKSRRAKPPARFDPERSSE